MPFLYKLGAMVAIIPRFYTLYSILKEIIIIYSKQKILYNQEFYYYIYIFENPCMVIRHQMPKKKIYIEVENQLGSCLAPLCVWKMGDALKQRGLHQYKYLHTDATVLAHRSLLDFICCDA